MGELQAGFLNPECLDTLSHVWEPNVQFIEDEGKYTNHLTVGI